MNFTAQGYAILNDRLNPDIAVLEGGYSIEGALPYMNLGIILAMAGLDYSHVKEPDYNREKLRQSNDITEYIKQLSDVIYRRWQKKDDIQREKFKGLEYVTRSRQIYYDTDEIMENQNEKFKICNKCSGLNTIVSKSDTGYRILAIIIPRDGCANCIDEGYALYKNSKSGGFYKVYLQDRVQDVFRSY